MRPRPLRTARMIAVCFGFSKREVMFGQSADEVRLHYGGQPFTCTPAAWLAISF